jgi:hypothetical protein
VTRMQNEKGVALGIVLVLSLVALALSAGLLYMVSHWAEITGMERRYRTAREAAKGGAEATYEFVDGGGAPVGGGDVTATAQCVSDKLNLPTVQWNAACDNTLTIVPGDAATYDLTLPLGNYTAFGKIVDTVPGNTVSGLQVEKDTGVVSTGTGEIAVMGLPYLYTVEVHAERSADPGERSKASALYQW